MMWDFIERHPIWTLVALVIVCSTLAQVAYSLRRRA